MGSTTQPQVHSLTSAQNKRGSILGKMHPWPGVGGRDHSTCLGDGWAQQKGVWSEPRPALALANGTQSPSVTAHPGWLLLSQCPGPPQTPGLLLHLGRKMNPTGGTNKEQVVGTSLVVYRLGLCFLGLRFDP